MAAKRYSFDGEMVTPAELARRITCYSEPWLAAALKAGCRSVRDLAVRWEEGRHRHREAGKRHRLSGRRRKLNFQHLKPRS